ncbi:MAG: DUF87 domain-containing protein [Candidatus Thiodiazotropha sp. (ex Epidulcina cf. delphinae)]|nr:DUF87 domain-containing protein [Candidatus Thiodiazotropha sp. (ex Epidulcina cf. delphinae)]
MSEIISDIEEDRKLSSTNETDTLLSGLIQEDQYVGDVYSMSYDSALVQIHDRYRMDAGGIPGLCFLIATRKKKNDNLAANDEDASVILLRVLDSSPLPNASEAERLRVEAAQRIAGEGRHWDEPGVMDAYTANLLGFAGLRCRIIGTFYAEQAPNSDRLRLRFGSDISNYYSNHALSVYKPNTSALGQIVNYRDLDSIKDHPLGQFCVVVGSVRYASTNRQEQGVDDVRINIAPADLLNMKTALFGMTRTGKSNTTKIIAKSVFELRYKDETNGRIGQIIFDYNGEYANENIQDKGALKRIWEFNDDGNEADVVTYGTEPHRNDANRRLLKLNFYADEMLPLGKQIIDDELSDDKAEFVRNFRNVSFEEVPENLFSSEGTRYRRCLLAYRALLSRSSFPLPANMTIPKGKNLFNPSLTKAMHNSEHESAVIFKHAANVLSKLHNDKQISWDQLSNAFATLYEFMTTKKSGWKEFNDTYMETSSSGESWADDSLRSILGMLGQGNGPSRVRRVAERHDPGVKQEYTEQILDDLHSGRLVIVDQSLGNERLNQIVADRIMEAIFKRHQFLFSHSKDIPEILVYIEEAHNLLPQGTDYDPTTIWPRVAKEGAKLKIGLSYATQEVSSVQKNILKNTSNWFIGHLNNTDETRELRKYYDFEDFERSIRRAQDRGFLRIKTLSNLYVVPAQIDLFRVG